MLRIAIAALALGAFVGSASAARDFQTSDGQFTICPLSDFFYCEVLTEQMMQTDHLSDEEKRTLRALKTLADKPRYATLALFQQAFGEPTMVSSIPGRTPEDLAIGAVWRTARRGPCCGIQAVFLPTGLNSLSYSASDRIMVFWFSRSEDIAPR
jgi:hypothetical protein